MSYQCTNYRFQLYCICCDQCQERPCDGIADGGACDKMCDCSDDLLCAED